MLVATFLCVLYLQGISASYSNRKLKWYFLITTSENNKSNAIQEFPHQIGQDKSKPVQNAHRSSRALASFGLQGLKGIQPVDNTGSVYIQPIPSSSKDSYVIPSMRPGRSSMMRSDGDMIPVLRFGRSDGLLIPYMRSGRSDDGSENIIPNLRPGRRSAVERQSNETLIPQIRYGRTSDDSSSGHLTPTMRFGRSDNPAKFRQEAEAVIFLLGENLLDADQEIAQESSDFVIPYPRPGKRYLSQLSNLKQSLLTPERLRMANIDKSVEESSSTSDFVLPYLRPGKKRDLEAVDDGYMLPVLRMGRSSVIPNMRPGRSSSIVPNMRPGRSSSIVPNMRPGRSSSIVPNMRPGRSSSVIPIMRPGRSESILPYLRPGRSTSILPYLRPGRSLSDDIFPYIKMSDYITPTLEDDFENKKDDDDDKKSNAEIDSGFFVSSLGIDSFKNSGVPSKKELPVERKDPVEENVYLLPGLRPGRYV